MANNFLMWGERGLVATLLLDMVDNFDENSVKEFLDLIELANQKHIEFIPQNMECIVEPDFSNGGFGHPDGIIVLENQNDEKIVLILEAKRTSYAQSHKESQSRGEKGYNSRINGQLELNYCLTTALSNFNEIDECLEDPSWILKTPYNDDRKNIKRILKSKVVINNIVKKIAGLDMDSYYHLILTHEDSNPFLKDNLYFPEIYDSKDVNKNIFEEFRSNFGWINYSKVKTLIENNVTNGKFLETFHFNEDNLASISNSPSYKGKKQSIIKKDLRLLPNEIKQLLYNISECFTCGNDYEIESCAGSISLIISDRLVGKIIPVPKGIFVGFRDYSLPDLGLTHISLENLYEVKIGGQAFWGINIPTGEFECPPIETASFVSIMKTLIERYV